MYIDEVAESQDTGKASGGKPWRLLALSCGGVSGVGRLIDDELFVLVVEIGHRRDVYD